MKSSCVSVAAVLLAVSLSSTTIAQTCATPLPIDTFPYNAQGSSCGQNLLPALNHGAIRMPGDDIVYRVAATHRENGASLASVTTTDPNFHPSLFLCSAPCGTDSECFDASDAGSGSTAYVGIPQDENSYYLIVDSQGTCGDYALTVNGFLDGESAAPPQAGP